MNPAGNLGGGRKVVTSAGTRVALVSTVVSTSTVAITAETDNTGKIAVGDSSVVAAEGSQTNGVVLAAGDTVSLDVSDPRQIYLDSTVSGDGVTYIYLAT